MYVCAFFSNHILRTIIDDLSRYFIEFYMLNTPLFSLLRRMYFKELHEKQPAHTHLAPNLLLVCPGSLYSIPSLLLLGSMYNTAVTMVCMYVSLSLSHSARRALKSNLCTNHRTRTRNTPIHPLRRAESVCLPTEGSANYDSSTGVLSEKKCLSKTTGRYRIQQQQQQPCDRQRSVP